MSQYVPVKSASSSEGDPSGTCFLAKMPNSHSNRISIGLSVFAALTIVTNMQTVATNHATPPVAVAMLCMRCGLIVMPFWFRGAFENS